MIKLYKADSANLVLSAQWNPSWSICLLWWHVSYESKVKSPILWLMTVNGWSTTVIQSSPVIIVLMTHDLRFMIDSLTDSDFAVLSLQSSGQSQSQIRHSESESESGMSSWLLWWASSNPTHPWWWRQSFEVDGMVGPRSEPGMRASESNQLKFELNNLKYII